MPEHSRLDALELAVARLTKEVVALRAEVRRLRGEAATGAGGVSAGSDAGGPPPTTTSHEPVVGASSFEPAPGHSIAPDVPGAPRPWRAGGAPPVTPRSPVGAGDASPFDRTPDPYRAALPAEVEASSQAAPSSDSPASLAPLQASQGRTETAGAGATSDTTPSLGATAGPTDPTTRRGARGTGSSRSFVDAAWAASIGDALDSGSRGVAARGDLEGLVGRYGTLALAALTILMGVGAFLGWAIRQGWIGPELRVAIGAAAALAVAGAGWRLRRGDSPRFGNILLALALAIMHVVCWGAGPLLGLVPPVLALTLAAAASGALALLALREGEQALFNVGFGGAFLAPFVTSSGNGDPLVLLVYGALVGAAGMGALRERDWSRTPFVLSLAIATYTAAATNELSTATDWEWATAPVGFALVNAWLALLLVRGRPRAQVAYVALVAALGGLVALTDTSATAWPRFTLAAVLTVTAFCVSRPGEGGRRSALLGALGLPAGALAVALSTLPDLTSPAGAGTALAWGMGSAVAAWLDANGERSTHAFTATAVGGLAIMLGAYDHDVPLVVALALYGAATSLAMPRLRLAGIGIAVFGWLAVDAAIAFSLLGERVAYAYTPFLTAASVAAGAVSAAWLVFSWSAARTVPGRTMLAQQLPSTVLRLLGAVVLFLWIREELAHAVSDDVSIFLLVAYYAIAGIVTIWIGRRRAVSMLRQVGLALAVFAAMKAIAESSDLTIGWRVAGYMLAGFFLLAVAYWYRAPGRAVTEGAAPDPA